MNSNTDICLDGHRIFKSKHVGTLSNPLQSHECVTTPSIQSFLQGIALSCVPGTIKNSPFVVGEVISSAAYGARTQSRGSTLHPVNMRNMANSLWVNRKLFSKQIKGMYTGTSFWTTNQCYL